MITAIVGALALLAGIGIGVFMSSLAFRHMMDAYSSTAAPAPIATDAEVGEDAAGTHDAAQRSAEMIGMTASEMWAAGIKTPEQAEADIKARWAAERPRTVIGRDSEGKPYAHSSGIHTTLADIADDMRTTMNDALPEVAANLDTVKAAQEATARGEELDPETQQLVEDWLTDEGHEHPMTPEQKAAYLRGMVAAAQVESGANMIADETLNHFSYAALSEHGSAGLMQAVTSTFDTVAEGGRDGRTLAEAGGAIRGAIGDGSDSTSGLLEGRRPITTEMVLRAARHAHGPGGDADTYKVLEDATHAPQAFILGAMEQACSEGLIEYGVSLETAWPAYDKTSGVYITDAAGNQVRDYPEDDK